MKVLIINPSWDRYVSQKGRRINRAWPPLDLLNCAALLEREGIAVDLIDARALARDPNEIAQQAKAYDIVFVTSSPLDRWQCPNLELDVFFTQVKPIQHPSLYVMGIHGTHFPDAILDNTGAKAVIQGEPEWTVLDIVRGKPLAEIAGLAYRDGTRTIRTAPRPLGALTELPIPAFHLLNWDHYGYELVGERFAVLETTRGCPFPCNFCQRDLYGGRAYRYKSAPQVGQEVEAVLNSGAQSGYFIDLEFSLNKQFTLDVCQALLRFRSRWKWCCQTRADSVDEPRLEAMKAAGCTLIHFGVESGSEGILANTEKEITLDQIAKGIELTKKAGIAAACFFMMGLPGETQEDRQKTLDFAKQINPTYASFHITSPYPGTPLYASRSWKQLYPESVLEGQELVQLKKWEKQAYRGYYLRFGYLASVLSQATLPQLAKQAALFWRLM